MQQLRFELDESRAALNAAGGENEHLRSSRTNTVAELHSIAANLDHIRGAHTKL